MSPRICDGQDETEVKAQLAALLNDGWVLEDEIELQKTYYFKTYTKVNDLHNVIAIESKAANHHPTMITKYSTLTVQWTTHVPRGLSTKDTRMAQFCDERAKRIGTVSPNDAQKCGPAPSASK